MMNEQTTKSTSSNVEPFVDFKNLPDTTTPFDADNMNTLQIMIKQYINAKHDIPIGGTTGQALVKNSNTDYDVSWATIYNKQMIVDLAHPVGSYYETSDASFDPNTYWGGTWVEDTEGLSTIAYKQDDSDFGTLGATVGEKEHQLTTEELPNITGQLNFHGSGGIGTILQNASGVFTPVEQIGQYDQVNKIGGANSFGYANLNFGENQPHNNIQPSKIVKRWHRIA